MEKYARKEFNKGQRNQEREGIHRHLFVLSMSKASVEHSVDDGDESLVHFARLSLARLLDVIVDAFRDGRRNILA